MHILFLQKRPLFPADTGGKIRTLNVLRHLARWHEVTYLCNVGPGEEEGVRETERLGMRVVALPWVETGRDSWRFYGELFANLFSRLPYNAAKDFDPRLKATAEKLVRDERFDLVICDFVQMAANAVNLNGVPKLLFQHNVEAEIFERHAQQDEGWLRRKYMGYQAAKMRRFEGWAGDHFDRVIAVSERDKQQYAERYGWSHVSTIDTAVDVDFFHPSAVNGASASDEEIVTFVGSLDWLPNVDGVTWFAREVWPRIRAQRPQAKLEIVGRTPVKEIGDLSGQNGIEVVPDVPDVRPWYVRAGVVIVPLRIGGGTRIKIYEAMAMSRPIVSTALGAEGLSFEPGTHIEIADSAEDIAASVSGLLADPQRRSRMGRQAREHVCENFSAERVARQFEEICLSTVRGDRASPATRMEPSAVASM